MFNNLVELRKLATDKKYATVRVTSKELLSLINEIELLREQLFNAEQQIYRVEKEQLATVKEHDKLLEALKWYVGKHRAEAILARVGIAGGVK